MTTIILTAFSHGIVSTLPLFENVANCLTGDFNSLLSFFHIDSSRIFTLDKIGIIGKIDKVIRQL